MLSTFSLNGNIFAQTSGLFDQITNKRAFLLNIGTQLLVSTAAALALYYVDTYIGLNNDKLFTSYLYLDDAKVAENMVNFNNLLFGVISFSIFKEFINVIESYMITKLPLSFARTVEDIIDNKVYNEQNLAKLSSGQQSNNDYQNIAFSSMLVSSRTSSYLTRGASLIIQAGIGTYMLFQVHPILPIISLTYGSLLQLITKKIALKIAELEKLATDNVDKEQKSLKQHGLNQYREIISLDAQRYNLEQLIKAKIYERSLREEKIILEKVLTLINKTASVVNIGIRWYATALMLTNGQIKPGDRAVIEIGMTKVAKTFAYMLDIAPEQANTQNHISKIARFQSKLTMETRGDSIVREYEENIFRIEEYNLSLGDNRIVKKIDLLECRAGDRCIIFGAIGCGKSTLFAKIKALNIYSDSEATGYFTYPHIDKDKSVMLITQDDYIPFNNKSIYQYVYLPKILPEDFTELENIKEEINRLVEEAGVSYLLDSHIRNEAEKSIESLSGGEKKILRLISAIIHKPSVLLLDETLKSLDQKARYTMYNMLDTYLKNTIIIASHHKDSNGKTDNFFNKEYTILPNRITTMQNEDAHIEVYRIHR